MISIKVTGISDVQQRLQRLSDELKRGQAVQLAINKTAEKARAEIKRAITAEYAVKAGEVGQAIELSKMARGGIGATISIFGSKSRRGRSMNLIHFLAAYQALGQAVKARGASGVKKRDLAALEGQLGFLIKKAGGLKRIEGAFVGNKGRTIFRRTGNARLPIEPLQVIGFSQMFSSKKIRGRVLKKINDELLVEVDRAVKLLLKRFK